MADYRIFPPEEIVETTVSVPLSKSIEARTLVLNYLAGKTETSDVCDDTRTLAAILADGVPAGGDTVDVGPAGTAMRFLTALYAATEGSDCLLTGNERMCHRPIGPLVEVLRHLGAHIEYADEEGFPPLRIHGRRLSGGTVDIDASVSSQFISAIMMVTPLLEAPLCIRLLGTPQSLPYIKMTAEMMCRRGAEVDFERDKIEISCPVALSALRDDESDWSAATFWYEIAALTAGWITIEGLPEHSLQGDSAVAALFERLGVLTEFTDGNTELSATPELYNTLEADVTDIPDAVPALAVTAAMVGIPFRLTGVAVLRHKESDRLQAIIDQLAKVGVMAYTEAYDNVLAWDGRRVPIHTMPEFDTYGDHRLAMALAPVSVYIPGIVVRDIDVVTKSYPTYWEDLQRAGFTLADPSDPLPEVPQQ